jgi:hypothetical protein
VGLCLSGSRRGRSLELLCLLVRDWEGGGEDDWNHDLDMWKTDRTRSMEWWSRKTMDDGISDNVLIWK